MITMEMYFENTNPPHNKFYYMRIEETLFHYVALRRHWGRIGKKGRVKVNIFDTVDEAKKALRALYRRRMRHGYRVVECRGILETQEPDIWLSNIERRLRRPPECVEGP